MTSNNSYNRDKARRLAFGLKDKFKESAMPDRHGCQSSAPFGMPEAAAPDIDLEQSGIYRRDAYNSMLDWCLSVDGAVRAFFTDARGLLIAERGDGGDWDVERLACQISEGMNVLGRCREGSPGPEQILFRLGDWWLGAARFGSHEEPLFLGLVAEKELSLSGLALVGERAARVLSGE